MIVVTITSVESATGVSETASPVNAVVSVFVSVPTSTVGSSVFGSSFVEEHPVKATPAISVMANKCLKFIEHTPFRVQLPA